jgi:hypothetical protein
MGVFAFVVFPVVALFRTVNGPIVWNPCGISGAFCHGLRKGLNPDSPPPTPARTRVSEPWGGDCGGFQESIHASLICHIGEADQGHFLIQDGGQSCFIAQFASIIDLPLKGEFANCQIILIQQR